MKKLIIGVLFFSFATFAALPTGHFAGQGNWQNAAGNGTYSGYVNIEDNGIGGNKVSVDFLWHGFISPSEISFTTNGLDSFRVYHNSVEVGEGYCVESQCYYDIEVAGTHYRENIFFLAGAENYPYVVRKGGKDDGSLVTTWTDEFFQQ